jgi:para-aminobenzoate synthetase/4-amino-4-deoxychorismate lyase
MFGARFDDIAGGQAFSLTDPVEEYVARTLGDVLPVLEKAAAAARDGLWVAGFVSYDAAPAFDDALTAGTPSHDALVWFGTFASREVEPLIERRNGSDPGYSVSRWVPLVERSRYESSFTDVKDHIRAGDTYQVNLTFPLRAAFSGDPGELYRDLVVSQYGSYASHVWNNDVHVVSVSPERFFAVNGRTIATKPMKGTMPRGRWQAEDDENRIALALSEKDRAENLMIVDLIRNDLGRIAEFGSVSADRLLSIEEYPTVWQMTSEVSATLRAEIDLVDVFSALFPCGSVTGAPKPRSMEIIADVESEPRGIYCGAIGFIPPGDGIDGASFSVAIRTGVLTESEGIASYGVGGGITWGSLVSGEYEEAIAKSRVLSAPVAPTGLMETIRWDDGWLWLDDHIERIVASASFLGISVSESALRSVLTSTASELRGPAKVRIDVSTEGVYSVNVDAAPDRFVLGPGPDVAPVTIALDMDPIDPMNVRLFHKTQDRSVYESRLRRHPEVEDVILTNSEGNITESTIANVAVLIDGVWMTPPVVDGLLPGIARARLVASGDLSEGSVSTATIIEADAIALVNSVRGWRPAVFRR